MTAARSCTCAALLLLAACGAPRDASRLTATVIGTPWEGGLAARLEAEATRPTLIAHDGSGAVVPGLASSWRFVDDDRGLILRLRPVKWSDNTPLEASAVVAAFKRAAARAEAALDHAGIAGSTPRGKLGVLAPISRVVEIRLAAPSPLLLGWLSDPALAVTAAGPVPTLAAYRAAGPATQRTLTRRSGTATEAARPATIVIASNPDPVAAIAAFSRGTSDIVIGDGLAGLGEARTVARPQTLQVDALWGVYGYVANGRKGALSDPRLRLALDLATNRAALAQRVGLAAMAPVEGLLPPSLRALPAPPPTLDMAGRQLLAKQLLATRMLSTQLLPAQPLSTPAISTPAPSPPSVGDDERPAPLRLTLLLPPGRDHRVIAEQVAADWQALGITLVISQVDAATIADKVRRGQFDLALTEASLAVPDAAALLSRWRCGAGPSCNPAADALFAAARAAPPADRPALLAAAEAKWMEGPPMIPLLTPLRWALVSPRVDGWTANHAGSHPLARLAVSTRR